MHKIALVVFLFSLANCQVTYYFDYAGASGLYQNTPGVSWDQTKLWAGDWSTGSGTNKEQAFSYYDITYLVPAKVLSVTSATLWMQLATSQKDAQASAVNEVRCYNVPNPAGAVSFTTFAPGDPYVATNVTVTTDNNKNKTWDVTSFVQAAATARATAVGFNCGVVAGLYQKAYGFNSFYGPQLIVTGPLGVGLCATDGTWPDTLGNTNASLPCGSGNTGSLTRFCQVGGIWSAPVNTCRVATTGIPTTAVPTTAVASTARPTTAVASAGSTTQGVATTAAVATTAVPVVTTAVPVSTTAVPVTTAAPATTRSPLVTTGQASPPPPVDPSAASSLIPLTVMLALVMCLF